MKDSFRVGDLNVAVVQGNTALVLQVDGRFNGANVRGRLHYGMSSPDDNLLGALDGDWGGQEEAIVEAVDGSPEFAEWAEYAMNNTDGAD